MKQKILASLFAAVLMLPLLTGCGAENTSEKSTLGSLTEKNSPKVTTTADGAAYPEITKREGASYGVSATVTKITPTGLTLNYYREAADETIGELFTGEWFALERCTDESGITLTWENVPLLLTAENLGWRDAAYLIPEQNKTILTLDWTTRYGALEPGAYRLVKILYERTSEGELYGEYDYFPFRIPAEAFAGYGLTLADVPAERMPASDPVVNGDFRMTAEDVTPRGATLRFSHEIIGGYGYYLERYNGETWERVPALPIGATMVPAIAIVMRDTRPISWTSRYGELEPGVYRIAKDMGSWDYNADYFAYFEITE